MGEGTRTALLVKGLADEEIVKRVVAATQDAPPGERIGAGLEAAIEMAEVDPAAARSTLHELRADPERLERIEAWLGGDPDRAALRLGAAIQVAYGELCSPSPDPRGVKADLLEWLEGGAA